MTIKAERSLLAPRDKTLASLIGRWFRSPRRTIACLVCVLGITSVLYWLQQPRFEARSDVVIVAIPSFSIQGTLTDISVDSAVRLLTSDRVLGTTARALDYPGGSSGLLDDLIISPVVNSRILRLYVRSEDSKLALNAVQKLSSELLNARSERLERSSEMRLEEIRVRLAVIDSELEAVTLGDEIAAREEIDVAALVDERTALEGERAGIEALPTEAGFIARAAEVAASPRRPYAPVFIGSGLAVGFCLSWVIAPATSTNIRFPNLEAQDD